MFATVMFNSSKLHRFFNLIKSSKASLASSVARPSPMVKNLIDDRLACLPIPDEKHEEAIELLRKNFFYEEPLNKAIGLCKPGESNAELENYCRYTLAQKYSHMIVDENDKVVGVLLNGVAKKSDREDLKRHIDEMTDEKFKKIVGFFYKINQAADLYSMYGVDDIFEVGMMTVDENYQKFGLGRVLISRGIETARNCGFKVVKGDATSYYSQRALYKNGFRPVMEIFYSEVEEELRPAPPHLSFQLMTKVLN